MVDMWFKVLISCLILACFQTSSSMGQEMPVNISKGKELFKVNCGMCHSTSTRIVGPQLTSELIQSRNRKWLIDFIRNGMELVNNGDTLAYSLYVNNYKSPHPDFSEKLKRGEIIKIIEYLESDYD